MSSATGIYVFITTIVQGLQYVFTPIKVITQGGPNYASSNLIYASYHEAFTLYRTGTSSAISILTMLLFIVLLLLEFKFVEKGVYYETNNHSEIGWHMILGASFSSCWFPSCSLCPISFKTLAGRI